MVTSTTPPLDDRVDALRKERGITLSELARATGIPRTTLSVKITNAERFEVSQLRTVSIALGVTLDYWLEAA